MPVLTAYKEELAYILPKLTVPTGKLKIKYQFGVSSKNADGDNLVKCFQDALAEQYGFNDRQVYEWSGKKVDVKKGEEFCAFEITPIT
jgi:Holliday junction resolvase RusA-like endonuclease